jgi:ADP-heptose:LPS heptosyltransferase
MIEPQAFGKRTSYWAVRCLDAFCFPAVAFAKMTVRGVVSAPSAWKKGLILGSTHLGDVLWRTSSLDLLRQGLPGCEWHYLASPDSAPLLENNPAIKGVIVKYLMQGQRRLAPGAIRELRSYHFDVALCTEKYQYVRELLVAIRAGIPNRVAYTAKGFGSLVTHPVPLSSFRQPRPKYLQEFFAHVAQTPASPTLTPKIYLDEEDTAQARAFVRSAGLDLKRRILAVFCKGRTSQANLSDPKLQSVLSTLIEAHDVQVLLCGTAREKAALEALGLSLGRGTVVCAGHLEIRAVAALLSWCHGILTPDSGPRHIGNAVGTPVVYVPCIAEDAVENDRYCDNETDLLAALGLERSQAGLAGASSAKVAALLTERMKPATQDTTC